MANTSELPINVVRSTKPKGLPGLNQKVRGQWPCSCITARRCCATGEQAEPTSSKVLGRNVVSPYRSLRSKEGKPQGRPMAVRVWGWEKAKAVL
jgi:hypothetical protein